MTMMQGLDWDLGLVLAVIISDREPPVDSSSSLKFLHVHDNSAGRAVEPRFEG